MKENIYRMVENRAKGGFGAVSTGEHPVNAEEGMAPFYEYPIDFIQTEGLDFEAMREYADRIKKYGAICYLELCHEGAQAKHNPPYSLWGSNGYVQEDGVEVKAFVSPWISHRTDEFGGSMENHARFPKMILGTCRRGIGEDGIIELRFSAKDSVPGGIPVKLVGDCLQSGKMGDAVRGGYMAAMEII